MTFFAQDVEKPLHRVDEHVSFSAVDGEADFDFLGVRQTRTQRDAPVGSGSGSHSREWSASLMSSASSGTELKSTPSASTIALTMAGAGPSMGSSPMPFAPNAPCGLPISSKRT